MPPAKSRYSRPSASQTFAPQARLTTKSVVAMPRGTKRSRAWRTCSLEARSSTRIERSISLAQCEANGVDSCALRKRDRLAAMRPLSPQFRPYTWALSTAEIAELAGLSPEDVLRFDGNTPPEPPRTARPETIADALGRINAYKHGGFGELVGAIADYNDVEPENVVLGAGADDVLMLCARAYAGPGDQVAIADEPSYPLYRVAVWVTGANVGDEDPVLTFVCRPHNPSGAMVDLPTARPLVVDEAYFEFGGQTAVPLLDDDVIVVRSFSKAFGLASARVGYALADAATAAELNARQQPAPVSTLSAALALAGLEAGRPDVS